MRVKVVRKTVEALGICSFELVSLDGENLPLFSAGAHIDVQVPNGMTRQYSLCNASSEKFRYLIAVLKDPSSRGGSISMHDEVTEGNELTVSEPKNHFPLIGTSGRSLLFAGGIGITPIISMAEHLCLNGSNFEVHYCTRDSKRTAFIERIRNSNFAGNVHFHFDDGDDDQKLELNRVLSPVQQDGQIYVCGPKGFIDAVLKTALGLNWPERNLHFESFTALPVDDTPNKPFQVILSRSRRTIEVPADKTVVEALAESGVDIPTSCKEGLCGTCLTRVLEGVPDHRDVFLTPSEQAKNDFFTPCCSRSKSARLVLDL